VIGIDGLADKLRVNLD
jgi:magnesium-transporting ATPase (P-type)